MAILTLTTDWGIRDHFAGALKGLLHSALPGITIVDITHQITANNIQQAAYIFKNCYRKFPAGSVHFIGVNNQKDNPFELIAIHHQAQFFIGMNNGVYSMIFDDIPTEIAVIDSVDQQSPGFDLETIAVAATHLASGYALNELGFPPKHFVQRSTFQPVIEEEVIRGIIIYIDEFGNVVTNIHHALFNEQLRGRKFEIVTLKLQNHVITEISNQYSDKEPGDMIAVFNSSGYLEIAINQDSASKLLGLKLNDNIRIEFK